MAKTFFKTFHNKKGEEFVEGAIVLPVIILTAVSFIMALVFLYNVLLSQCKVQDMLLEKSACKDHLYKKIYLEEDTSSRIGGLADLILTDRYRGEITVIDEAELIRLGGIIHDE